MSKSHSLFVLATIIAALSVVTTSAKPGVHPIADNHHINAKDRHHQTGPQRHHDKKNPVFAVDQKTIVPHPVSGAPTAAVERRLNVPPRYMWGWGPGLRGYCGETSFQSHGIFWGNWISSEIIRNAADGRELLLSVNAEDAAKALKFTYEVFDTEHEPTPQGPDFVSFCKRHIDEGHLVVGGFFEQMPADDGDSDYDHIMPVIGYKGLSSSAPPSGEVAAAASYDVAGLYYNDLYGKTSRYFAVPEDVKSRSSCEQSSEPTQPYTYCITSKYAHAIALTGIQDVNAETYRMWLTIPEWTEPDWGKEDKLHQSVKQFTVTATITGLTQGVKYVVLRFDDKDALPTSDFINSSYSEQFKFIASGTTHTLTNFDSFMSDASVFYRCVIDPTVVAK